MTAPGYNLIEELLPAIDGGKRLRRIAAETPEDGFDHTISAAYEFSDGTWAVSAGQLTEQLTDIHDPSPVTADSESTARKWIELIARLYVLAVGA